MGYFISGCKMIGMVDYIFIFFFVGIRIFKKAEPEFKHKHTAAGIVYIFLVDLTVIYKALQRVYPKVIRIFEAALTVESVAFRKINGALVILYHTVNISYSSYAAPIGTAYSLKTKPFFQYIFKIMLRGHHQVAVDRIIAYHNIVSSALFYRRFKNRQITAFYLANACSCGRTVHTALGNTVNAKMLGLGYNRVAF